MADHHQVTPDDPRPLVTTTGKVIGFAILVLTSLLGAYGWLLSNRFEAIVDSRFDKFELRLMREYVSKGEAVNKGDYQVDRADVANLQKQLGDRIAEGERRLAEIERRLNVQAERSKK